MKALKVFTIFMQVLMAVSSAYYLSADSFYNLTNAPIIVPIIIALFFIASLSAVYFLIKNK